MAVSYGTYTITEVQEGSQIWTTTVAPVSPNYTFTISNLTGDSETSIKVGDIIMYSYYRYTVLSISDDGTTVLTGNRVSIRGATGAASVTYTLIVSNLAIIKDKDGNLSPSTITVTAKSQTGSNAMANYTGRIKIETTTDNSTWTSRINEDAATKTYTIPSDTVAIRCSLYLKGGTTTLLDQQTIPVVSDGLDGTNGNDAYSIILTNENHTFTGNTTSALASEIECNVIAYKGTTQVASTIGTITGQPTGMTTSLLNNGTVNSAFKVAVTTSMVTRNGVLSIPITVDGKTFTKEFTYALTLNGEKGDKGDRGTNGASQNLLLDAYAPSLAKVDAPSARYFSDASNSTITGQFIAEDNLPDPNATHFVRLTDSSASTHGRGLCFYSSGTPPFINGHTYRIGCWVRKHAGSPKVQITLGSYGSWMPAQRKIENTEWEWIEVVRTFGETDASKTTQSDTYKRLYFYFYNNNVAGSSLDMCGFRMEEIQTNSGTARNLLLGTEKLIGWGTTSGTTISDGVITFPYVSSNTWREVYPVKNFKYDLIRNQSVIFSIKVKGNVEEVDGKLVGEKCCINLDIGVDTIETAYERKKHFNQYVYFTGTGEWETVCSALPIFDYMFTSGSGTVDFDDCWVTVRIGAVTNYWNGFQAKEPQLSLGTTATSWTPAPEDIENEVSNLRTDLQAQIDEKIQTYYQATAPSWSSTTERAKHNGDLWYCTESDPYTGYEAKNVYRYDSASNTWVEYSATSELFDKVDGKSTIFYGTTSDTFTDVDTGDYLVNSVDGSSYRWDGTQWVKVTDYQTAINNIEIGGRNLLKKSNNLKSTDTTKGITFTYLEDGWFAVKGTVTGTSAGVLCFYGNSQHTSNISGSGEYTLSIETTSTILNSNKIYIQTAFHSNSTTDNTVAGGFNIFSGSTKVTFSIPENHHISRVCLFLAASATGETVDGTIRFKLEKGNKATDWTPAPEDIDNNIATVQTNADAVNLSPYFSYSPYVVNDYWKSWSNQPAITFTEVGDGWVRIQCTNTDTSTIRKDFYPIYNLEIKEGTDYTWLIEFRNNQSQIDGTASGSDFYLVQTNNCQFWGGTIKENIEGMGTGSTTRFIDNIPIVGTEVDGITITKDFVYKKRFIKTSESTGSSRWTDGSADNLVGLACFTARCAKNTTIDCEVRISLYEGKYLGEYKPYVDSAASGKIEEAKKVATNYLSMDSTGIMIADMNDGEQKPSEATGRNVFIDNDSVDIRNGTSTLASFTGNDTKFYDPIYNKELATFGASGAMIGVEGEQRFVIEKDSVRAINSSGGTLFSIVSTDKTFITEAEAAPSGECDDSPLADYITRTLDAGDSTTDNSFYIDRIYIIVSLTNSSKVLTNVKINSIAVTADRIKYNTNTAYGFPYSSSHFIDVPFSPAFSCNYGTSKSSDYVMTATFINDYGDSYNLTFSFKITYNGARKLTFWTPTEECIRISGNNEAIAKFDVLNRSKYVFSQVISNTANTRAPAITFGTRTGEDGMLSSAFGQGLYAEKDGEFVIGRYNNQELQTDSKYSFVIGNGLTEEHRSNALTIDWSGNICLGIDVTGSETDADLLTAIQNAGWESSVIE